MRLCFKGSVKSQVISKNTEVKVGKLLGRKDLPFAPESVASPSVKEEVKEEVGGSIPDHRTYLRWFQVLKPI